CQTYPGPFARTTSRGTCRRHNSAPASLGRVIRAGGRFLNTGFGNEPTVRRAASEAHGPARLCLRRRFRHEVEPQESTTTSGELGQRFGRHPSAERVALRCPGTNHPDGPKSRSLPGCSSSLRLAELLQLAFRRSQPLGASPKSSL